MIKRIIFALSFAAMLTAISAPVQAAAYLIAGKWYFFSLDFESTVARVTGKDLKTGTRIDAEVKVTNSEAICLNPTGKFVNPGQGPVVKAFGSSGNLSEDNLVKDNRVKNTFQTTTVVDLKNVNPCKQSNGAGAWTPVYWQNYNCIGKPATVTSGDLCYSRLASYDGSQLRLLAQDGSFYETALNSTEWTYVYLPTAFKSVSTVENTIAGTYDTWYRQCTISTDATGVPFSLSNPPESGWAEAKVTYNGGPGTVECFPISKDTYTLD